MSEYLRQRGKPVWDMVEQPLGIDIYILFQYFLCKCKHIYIDLTQEASK